MWGRVADSEVVFGWFVCVGGVGDEKEYSFIN